MNTSRHYQSRPITSLFVSLGLLTAAAVDAQSIVAHFVAEATSGLLSADSLGSNIASATITRGPDLVAVDDFAGFYDSSGWSTSGAFPGVSDGSYLQVELEVATGFQIELESIGFAYSDAGSDDSAQRLELRHSGDNFASVLFVDTSVAVFPDLETNNVGLSLINQTFTNSVLLRLYGYGAVNDSGVLGLANDAALAKSGKDGALVLSGNVTPVPESAYYGFILALATLAATARLRVARLPRR